MFWFYVQVPFKFNHFLCCANRQIILSALLEIKYKQMPGATRRQNAERQMPLFTSVVLPALQNLSVIWLLFCIFLGQFYLLWLWFSGLSLFFVSRSSHHRNGYTAVGGTGKKRSVGMRLRLSLTTLKSINLVSFLSFQPPLIQSIFAGDVDEVKTLLSQQHDVNCQGMKLQYIVCGLLCLTFLCRYWKANPPTCCCV